jgi:hypothetical protein
MRLAGGNLLHGGDGNDTLIAGIISVDYGTTVDFETSMYGGDGHDTFAFRPMVGSYNSIMDFEKGDRIDLRAFNISFEDLYMIPLGEGRVVVSLDGSAPGDGSHGDLIQVFGLGPTNVFGTLALTAHDFLF